MLISPFNPSSSTPGQERHDRCHRRSHRPHLHAPAVYRQDCAAQVQGTFCGGGDCRVFVWGGQPNPTYRTWRRQHHQPASHRTTISPCRDSRGERLTRSKARRPPAKSLPCDGPHPFTLSSALPHHSVPFDLQPLRLVRPPIFCHAIIAARICQISSLVKAPINRCPRRWQAGNFTNALDADVGGPRRAIANVSSCPRSSVSLLAHSIWQTHAAPLFTRVNSQRT